MIHNVKSSQKQFSEVKKKEVLNKREIREYKLSDACCHNFEIVSTVSET